TGDQVIRGTPDQRGRSFGLKHIPWLLAIESGLTEAADRNRAVVLELLAVPDDRRGRLDRPAAGELRRLGVRGRGGLLGGRPDALARAARLAREAPPAVRGRRAEVLAPAVAALAAMIGEDVAAAARRFAPLAAAAEAEARDGVGDEARLLADL